MKFSKRDFLLILLFSAVYFVSYLTRTNYAAVMIEMITAEGISEVEASLALTISAITYGVGQLVSGYLGDKIKPERIILAGLAGATLMNGLISLLPWVWMRSVLWGINGFSQAMIWPPLVRIMSGMFSQDVYKKATLWVSLAASFATVCVYLVSPIIIKAFSWHGVFITSSCIGIVMCIVWLIISPKLDYTVKAKEQAEKPVSFKGTLAIPIIAVVFGAIVLQGILRDGLTTWTPTLVKQSFDLDTGAAIFTGVIMPIFSMLSLSVTSVVLNKLIKNEFLCASFFFGVGAIGLVLMSVSNILIISLIGGAIAQGVMHGVNYCFTCIVPAYFRRFNRTSFVAGLINCGAYVGSAIAGLGTAFLAEHFEWNIIVLIWAGIAATGCLIGIVFKRLWVKFSKSC